MKRFLRGTWLAAALSAAALAAWGCAPFAIGAESTGAVGVDAYSGEAMPEATPDPVPDPEAAVTTAPGEHLDAVGTITALDEATITVDGVAYSLTPSTEVKGAPTVGGRIKLEYTVNADGSRTVIEAKTSEFFEE